MKYKWNDSYFSYHKLPTQYRFIEFLYLAGDLKAILTQPDMKFLKEWENITKFFLAAEIL